VVIQFRICCNNIIRNHSQVKPPFEVIDSIENRSSVALAIDAPLEVVELPAEDVVLTGEAVCVVGAREPDVVDLSAASDTNIDDARTSAFDELAVSVATAFENVV